MKINKFTIMFLCVLLISFVVIYGFCIKMLNELNQMKDIISILIINQQYLGEKQCPCEKTNYFSEESLLCMTKTK